MSSRDLPPVVVNDSTLRDGEQAPGVAFTAPADALAAGSLAAALGLSAGALASTDAAGDAPGDEHPARIATVPNRAITIRSFIDVSSMSGHAAGSHPCYPASRSGSYPDSSPGHRPRG